MPANSTVTKSRRLLISGGYAALAVGFLLVGVIPYVRGVSSANAAIAQHQHEVDQRTQVKAALVQTTREIQDMDFQVRNYSRLVPPNQDLGGFLQQLSEELTKAGMRDVDVRNQAAITLTKSQKLPITLKATGTFEQFHSFLTALEHLPRLSSIGQITLEAAPDMSGTVTVNLTLFIYNSKPNSPVK